MSPSDPKKPNPAETSHSNPKADNFEKPGPKGTAVARGQTLIASQVVAPIAHSAAHKTIDTTTLNDDADAENGSGSDQDTGREVSPPVRPDTPVVRDGSGGNLAARRRAVVQLTPIFEEEEEEGADEIPPSVDDQGGQNKQGGNSQGGDSQGRNSQKGDDKSVKPEK